MSANSETEETTSDSAPDSTEAAPSTTAPPETAPPETTAPPATEAEPEPAAPDGWLDSGNGVLLPKVLLDIRFCESTNRYDAANSHSSARGAYQFLTVVGTGMGTRTAMGSAKLTSPPLLNKMKPP